MKKKLPFFSNLSALIDGLPKNVRTNFWKDPWIASHVLDAHLDPSWDEGSRKPEKISSEIASIVRHCKAHRVPAQGLILDLGCGPGLYAQRLVSQGYKVEGWDISPAAVRWARKQIPIKWGKFHLADFSIARLPPADAAIMVYGIFCNLSDSERDRSLASLAKSLPPGAPFIFDVFTEEYVKNAILPRDWYAVKKDGFWKADRHIVLEESFLKEEERCLINSYHVVNRFGKINSWHIRHRWYEQEELKALLLDHGFSPTFFGGGLAGDEDPELWQGVLAKRQ